MKTLTIPTPRYRRAPRPREAREVGQKARHAAFRADSRVSLAAIAFPTINDPTSNIERLFLPQVQRPALVSFNYPPESDPFAE